MAQRLLFILPFLFSGLLVDHASAQQEVVLRSGATLQGVVSVEDDKVVVTIGDAPIRVPFADVLSISSDSVASSDKAEQLLRASLETLVLRENAEGATLLLAEAHRHAPNDFRIAFWRGYTLAETDQGEAASIILKPHRERILKEFPGAAERLFDRVGVLATIESMPDELSVAVKNHNRTIDQLLLAENRRVPSLMVFRVTDQFGKPADKDVVRVNHHYGSKNLTSYSDGYYAYRYERDRQREPQPLKVIVNGASFKPAEFQVPVARAKVLKCHSLVAARFGVEDKKVAMVKVMDGDGNLLTDANVQLYGSGRIGGRPESFSLKTDINGIAKLKLFPGRYRVSTTKQGYRRGRRSVSLNLEKDMEEPDTVVLHRALIAKLLVQVRSRADGTEVNLDHVEAIVDLTERGLTGNQRCPWLQLMQLGDSLVLGVGQNQNHAGGDLRSFWIREKEKKSQAQTSFDQVPFTQWGKFRSVFGLPDSEKLMTSHFSQAFRVKEGDELIGAIDISDNALRGKENDRVSNQFRIKVQSIEMAELVDDEPGP